MARSSRDLEPVKTLEAGEQCNKPSQNRQWITPILHQGRQPVPISPRSHRSDSAKSLGPSLPPLAISADARPLTDAILSPCRQIRGGSTDPPTSLEHNMFQRPRKRQRSRSPIRSNIDTDRIPRHVRPNHHLTLDNTPGFDSLQKSEAGWRQYPSPLPASYSRTSATQIPDEQPTSLPHARDLEAPDAVPALSQGPTLPPMISSANEAPQSTRQADTLSTPTTTAQSSRLADLQHQLTQQTTAHSNLQATHTALLARVQSDKTRTEALAKKSSVAEDELNILSIRNEELTEHLQLLQSQLEEREGKFDAERALWAREKAQWLRMFENGAKMQVAASEQRRAWGEERARLLAVIERGPPARMLGRGDAAVTTVGLETMDKDVLLRRIESLTIRQEELQHALRRAQEINERVIGYARSIVEDTQTSHETIGRFQAASPS